MSDTTRNRTPDDVVLYEVSERIATITLNRPEARNALSSDVLRRLPELMQQADADTEVDVVVLTGTDPAFCAGLDLKELGSTAGNLGATGAAAGPTPTACAARSPPWSSRSSGRSTVWPSPVDSSSR